MVIAVSPDGVNSRRDTRGGISSADRIANHVAALTINEAANAAATGMMITRRHSGPRDWGATDAIPAGVVRLPCSLSTNNAIEMSPTRSPRSFSRHRRSSAVERATRPSVASSSLAPASAHWRACRRRPRPGTLACPVSISYSTQPNAQMSARLSTGFPRACSGTHVRRRAQDHPDAGHHRGRRDRRRLRRARRCAPGGSIAFASPKSSTFTVPSGRTLMFAGLRSR